MRKKLSTSEGERRKFIATFSRVGKKRNFKGYAEDTILLTDVKDAELNSVVADHVWFSYSQTFDKAHLREGDEIEFEARVKAYEKGYVNKQLGINQRKEDFKLSNPTKVKVLKKG